MQKTTITKKAAVKTASLNVEFAFGIPKGAKGALVKNYKPGQVPSLKVYPGLVNLTTSGAKTATALLRISGKYCWAPANKVIFA